MESIRISGAGSVSGGVYDEVVLAGAADVRGRIKCNLFKSSGAASCIDTVEAETFKASGSLKLDGDLLAKEAKLSGAAKITGKLEASNVNISGSIVIDGDVNVDVLECNISNGAFENIYGDNIRINSEGHSFFTKKIVDVVKNIRVKEIEATSISIQDVTADRISGEIVSVKSGCKIKTVEYSKTLDISSKAKIERIIKL